MEHWLPLFYEQLDTLFDYLPRALVLLGHQAEEAQDGAAGTDRATITRPASSSGTQKDDKHAIKAPPYKPLKPETLYLTDADWKAALAQATLCAT